MLIIYGLLATGVDGGYFANLNLQESYHEKGKQNVGARYACNVNVQWRALG